MKKAIMMVFASVIMASCGGGSSEPVVVDSTVVDSTVVDTVAQDTTVQVGTVDSTKQ